VRRRALLLTAFGAATLMVLGYGGQSLARVWHMKREVESLTALVTRLRTDPELIEQVAREDLGLVKPGERILKLPPSPPQRGR
jgi:cell division protein FtsB